MIRNLELIVRDCKWRAHARLSADLCIAPDLVDWMVEQRGFEPPAPTARTVPFSGSELLSHTRRQDEAYH